MKHPPDHIDGVLGTLKAFLQLDRAAVRMLYFNIPPRVDVDFLDRCRKCISSKIRTPPFRCRGVRQLAAAHAVYRDTAVMDVFGDVAFELCLGILAAHGDRVL